MPYADKEKHREYCRANSKRKYLEHAEWLRSLKTKCQECGSTENLDFHHRDPGDKEFDPFRQWSFSKARLLKEIAKCDVLCRSCHKKVEGEDSLAA